MREAVSRGHLSKARAEQCGIEARQVEGRVEEIMAMKTPWNEGLAGW